MDFLPSKRVLSIFIIIAALVGSIIIAFGRDKGSAAINYASSLLPGEKLSLPANPAWQNDLGVLENAGPIQVDEVTSGESVTDTVSKSFMANYLAIKKSGKLDGESAQKLIDQTINYLDKTATSPIGTIKLNIIPDGGKQSIIDYGENLGKIAKQKKPSDISGELGTIMEIMQTGNQSKIEELDAVIAGYEKITADLIKMPVPSTFAKAHLDITNGTRGIALSFSQMKNVLNDPFQSLTALQLYNDSVATLSQALEATVGFILKNNITYKQGSSGYYLIYGI